MREHIISELKRIEQSEQIKILFAVESGSRAWGVPSKDSDYDVRFVYIHPKEWYLSIDVEEKRDVLQYPINDSLDLSGWDIRKALLLFQKSNPSIMEWIHSPIVYLEPSTFLKELLELSDSYFSPKKSMYHYLHMASSNYRGYLLGKEVKIKKYFYVLRPILACKWLERYNTVPPMQFETLVETLVTDPILSNEIKKLLDRKKSGEEFDVEPRIDVINHFLEEKIQYYQGYVKHFEDQSDHDFDRLNKLFRTTLNKVWSK